MIVEKDLKVQLRFDIDTIACAGDRLNALLGVLESYNAKAVFYLNIGRSISYRHIFYSIYKKRHQSTTPIIKLSPYKKLGRNAFFQTLIQNPRLIDLKDNRFREIISAGHSIGLHGGWNHSLWQHDAHIWSKTKLHDEILTAKEHLENKLGIQVYAFSSPGWNSPGVICTTLSDIGFKYIADTTRDDPTPEWMDGILELPTNFRGEPGHVGYLEYLYAKNKHSTHDTIKEIYQQQWQTLSTIYDHPCFAGGIGLPLMDAMLSCQKEKNITYVTPEDFHVD